MSNSTDPTPQPPIDDPWMQQTENDLAAYQAQSQLYQNDMQELKALIASIATMANPLEGAQMVMLEAMNLQGDKVGGEGELDNIDSDLRTAVTNAENEWNQAYTDYKAGNTAAKEHDLAQFDQDLQDLADFVKANSPSSPTDSNANKYVIDYSDGQNITTTIASIANEFGGNWSDQTPVPDGVGHNMAVYGGYNNWEGSYVNGQSDPHITAIQSDLQTLNQSTSALSTTTNSEMQYVSNVYQQEEGITNDTMQTYQKLVSTWVNNQRSN